MIAFITIDASEIVQAIDRALQQLTHPRPLMEEIGAKLESNALVRWDQRVDPTGTPWAPLSPTTVAIYESEWFIERNPEFRGGIPGGLLERTRRLRESLAYNPDDDHVDIGTLRPTEGGKWEIGMLHEFGTTKMPRRGILTADPEQGELGAADEADVLQLVDAFIAGAFGD